MQNKNKCGQRPTEIILFKQPKRILEKSIQEEIIKQYHGTPHDGHGGVLRTVIWLKQSRIIPYHTHPQILPYLNCYVED